MPDPENKASPLTAAESNPGDTARDVPKGARDNASPERVSTDRAAAAQQYPAVTAADGGKLTAPSQFFFFAGVFLLTLTTLMLEIIQTRILSVVSWYYFAFFIISIAMFGMTAGAVWVYMRHDRFTEKTLSRDLVFFTTAFALSIALSLAVQMTLVPTVVRTVTSIIVWVELAICMAVPFFFSGVAVSLALTRSPYSIGRVYGFDLAGAALGCLGALLVLNITDGPSAILWTAAIGAAAAVAFTKSGIGVASGEEPALISVLRRPKLVLCLLAFVALGNSLAENGLRPLAIKGQIALPTVAIEFEEWNTFSRIIAQRTVKREPHMWGPSPMMPQNRWLIDQKKMTIDGQASSRMYRFTENVEDMAFLKYDITNLGYFLPDRERAAVIGVSRTRFPWTQNWLNRSVQGGPEHDRQF